ncbi:uncharacterized protein LOC130613049 [Hydractinia symbiolongicarpus]|uniref:uncharacterized protein LOC130613049 n=1 Tax=Hydractinia symbiolongicarpus TaxID=13093 RepID=UPI00254E3880|nr:uncharacterized protein LOC130613049 [Hydractinia symbiolongicarpus]
MARNYVMDDITNLENSNKEQKFTVKTKSKIERIEENRKTDSQTSVCLALVKWIVTILMFLMTLSCLVASKMSIISIAIRLRPASFNKTTSTNCLPNNNCEAETAFVMITLLITIPQVISLLRAIRNSAFSKTELWPSKFSIFMGIIGAVLETFGLCFFTLVLISTTDNFARAVLFMNGIFVFPILLQIITECRKILRSQETVSIDDTSYVAYESENQLRRSQEQPHHWRTFFLFLLSALSAISGFVFIMFQAQEAIDRIIFPVSMICLSIAWSPKLFKKQIQPSAANMLEENGMAAPSRNMHVNSARHRMMLISCSVKIILTFLIAFLLNYVFNVTTIRNPGDSFANGFKYFTKNKALMNTFFVQLSSSFLGYLLAWLACTMNLQKVCFVLPLLLATPVSVALSIFPVACHDLIGYNCERVHDNNKVWETIVIGVLFWLSQVLSLNFYFFKSQQFLMAREEILFWLPTYDGCLLEQHLLLNRKNEVTDERYINYHEIVKESHIYICTTMYHEADFEMEQLLQSLAKVDQARKECGRQFEAHVWLDDGARGEVVKWYALQLLSLVKDIMDIDPGKAFKLETPYGMQLKWLLPHGMPFIIHLKDKVKVKAKKRWSQVMYMSYILDFKQVKERDDLTYILATDADVQFTPNDVMALMDFMSRNPKVGAVCGRTHPMGSGPMVWYQIFDYAIGHWLLKVANHVFGSVLCSPGCFSVYRAKAIRDVLPLYASGVDCAMDFLMKDMGEDRWFCTLLVEAGWKLEYCATAVDSTYCPDNFDEFFKQRRRWGPSTLANSIVVLDKHKTIRENNDAISIFFIIYQAVLMISTIIGPSTVLLVIAGGLQYAFPYTVNLVVVLILLILTTLIFTLICLYCKPDTQLKAAKILTFGFAIIMSITIVGIILQTVDDIHNYVSPPTLAPPTTPRWNRSAPTLTPGTTLPTHYVRVPYIFTPATWYLLTIIGIFIVTAFLHGLEGLYLIHGIWYLLCLPSGYLLLTIYSVANLTDRSWGTREGKTQSQDADMPFTEKLLKYLKYFCWCCIPPHMREKKVDDDDKKNEEEEEKHFVINRDDENEQAQGEREDEENEEDKVDGQPIITFDAPDDEVKKEPVAKAKSYPIKSALKKGGHGIKKYPSASDLLKKGDHGSFRFPGQDKMVTFAPHQPRLHAASTVEEWLRLNAPREYQCYVENFKNAGYDNVAFIAGALKEKDLINIGIENRGHRKRLMILIESLPPEELFQEVPENVEEWLMKLGLEEYWPKFLANSYTEPRDLADIKYMTRDTISALFDINKEAHIKKLLMATSVLQYPTKAQTRIREARKAIMADPPKQLQTDNADDGEEFEFWEELRQICLLPEQAAFNQSGELVEKLGDLRDTCLMVLTVANVLWLTFMVTIMEQGDKLAVLGTSFASVAFLFVYGLVLVFQFISLLWHRLETAVHFIARAPFKPGHFKSNWSWRDDDLPPPPDPDVLDEIRRRLRKISSTSNFSDDSRANMAEPLLRPRVQTS